MRFLVAVDNKASFKEIKCHQGTDTSKKDGIQPVAIATYKYSSEKADKIAKLTVFSVGEYRLLAVVRNNYNLQIFKISDIGEKNYSYNLLKSIVLHFSDDDDDDDDEEEVEEATNFIALGIHNEFLYMASESGEVFFVHFQDILDSITEEDLLRITKEIEESKQATNEETEEKETGKKLEKTTAPKTVIKTVPTIPFTGNLVAKYLKLNVSNKLHAFVGSKTNLGVFAYGGENEDLKIVSVNEQLASYKKNRRDGVIKIENFNNQTVVFETKNVKNNRLDLLMPIWISGILFINEKQNIISSSVTKEDFDNKTAKLELLASTYYGNLRRYDTSHGRKPIANHTVFTNNSVSITQKPKILALSSSIDPSQVIVSDDHTSVVKLDYIKNQQLGKFTGMQGAIPSLYTSVAEPNMAQDLSLLVTGGLDKYLRVFDIESRQQVAKVFVKSRINCVYYLPENVSNKRKLDEESDNDDIWDQLEETKSGDNSKKSKKGL